MADKSKTQRLKMLLLASCKPAYFVMDETLQLIEWSENLQEYGYQNMEYGQPATDIFDFLVGYPVGQAIELPIVETPAERHASISILPEDNKVNVLILDATQDYEKQRMLQQKANEAELLSVRQRLLMKELFATQKELTRKNRQLEEASRLQSRFLSGVSHEFRTPLTSIIGYTEVVAKQLAAGVAETGKLGEKLNVVDANGKYLLALVENLLDHGRLDAQALSIAPAPVELGPFFVSIHTMLKPLAQNKEIELRLHPDKDYDAFVYMDETRVRQCVVNIANNAIKFTDQGGVDISYRWRDNELQIVVSDTGIGISEEDQEQLFVSFWQSREHDKAGTGLGLTITQRLVELMGGEIAVDSQLGAGTAMTITLPVAAVDEALLQPETPQVAEKVDGRERVIWLVEDDADIADLVEAYLLDWGYRVKHLPNGQQAVDRWQQQPDAELVLMDINMPVLAGLPAIEQLRDLGCDVPIFIMSAKVLDEQDPAMASSRANGHMLKPLDFELLSDTLRQAFEAGNRD